MLPDGAIRILVKADIDTIKERFKTRMHGNIPAAVARMLENKHGIFDSGVYDYSFFGMNGNVATIFNIIKNSFYKIRPSGTCIL